MKKEKKRMKFVSVKMTESQFINVSKIASDKEVSVAAVVRWAVDFFCEKKQQMQ